MQEKTQSAPTRVAAGGGLDSVFGDDSIFTPTATVTHGVHRATAPADQTVREIRRRLHDRLALHDESQAIVNGREVSDDTLVRAGQTLDFMRKAGEKGADPRPAAAPGRGP